MRTAGAAGGSNAAAAAAKRAERLAAVGNRIQHLVDQREQLTREARANAGPLTTGSPAGGRPPTGPAPGAANPKGKTVRISEPSAGADPVKALLSLPSDLMASILNPREEDESTAAYLRRLKGAIDQSFPPKSGVPGGNPELTAAATRLGVEAAGKVRQQLLTMLADKIITLLNSLTPKQASDLSKHASKKGGKGGGKGKK